MKNKRFYMTVILLLSCSLVLSCSYGNINEIESAHEEIIEDPLVLLFSNDNNLNTEKQYYDALLSIQDERDDHPEINIVQAEDHEDLVDNYEVTEFPTLVLVSGSPPYEQVNGDVSNEELLNKLREHFSLPISVQSS